MRPDEQKLIDLDIRSAGSEFMMAVQVDFNVVSEFHETSAPLSMTITKSPHECIFNYRSEPA